jgi:hypothetical protein
MSCDIITKLDECMILRAWRFCSISSIVGGHFEVGFDARYLFAIQANFDCWTNTTYIVRQ